MEVLSTCSTDFWRNIGITGQRLQTINESSVEELFAIYERMMFSQPQYVFVEQTLKVKSFKLVNYDVGNLGAITSDHFLFCTRNVYMPYLLGAEEFVEQRKFIQKTPAISDVILENFRKEYLSSANNKKNGKAS